MFTYVARTTSPEGFVTRSSDSMRYTHALITPEGGAFSWHLTEQAARKASQAGRVASYQLQVVPVERHEGGKAKVERALRAEQAAAATVATRPYANDPELAAAAAEAIGYARCLTAAPKDAAAVALLDQAAVEQLLGRASAAAEHRPTTTVEVPDAMAATLVSQTTSAAQLQDVRPGQAFTYQGRQLRMVKVGKASFRAELEDGSLGTVKARPTAVVELAIERTADVVPMAPKADRKGRTARGRQVPAGKTGDPRADRKGPSEADVTAAVDGLVRELAQQPGVTFAASKGDTEWLDAQLAKTLASKMDKPTAEGVAPGTVTDSGYLVRWTPTRHTALLVRKLGGKVEWVASCTEHVQSHPASSVGEADKLARGRATWCTSCQA